MFSPNLFTAGVLVNSLRALIYLTLLLTYFPRVVEKVRGAMGPEIEMFFIHSSGRRADGQIAS
jgi:hypothetical protein